MASTTASTAAARSRSSPLLHPSVRKPLHTRLQAMQAPTKPPLQHLTPALRQSLDPRRLSSNKIDVPVLSPRSQRCLLYRICVRLTIPTEPRALHVQSNAHRHQGVPAAPERSAGAQGEPTGQPAADTAGIPALYTDNAALRQSHQRVRDHRHADSRLDKPDEFPYRSRPGCSRCGDQEPAELFYTPVLYADPTGHPQPDTFKHVSLCADCKHSRPTWRDTFSVQRVYHTIPRDDDDADDASEHLPDAAARQHAVHQACMQMRHVKYGAGVKVGLNFAGLPRLAAGATPADVPTVFTAAYNPPVPDQHGRLPITWSSEPPIRPDLTADDFRSPFPSALPATPQTARPMSPPTSHQPDDPAPTDPQASSVATTPTCPPTPAYLAYTPALSAPDSAASSSPTQQFTPCDLPADVLRRMQETLNSAMSAAMTASPASQLPSGNTPATNPRRREDA